MSVPAWLTQLAARADGLRPERLARFVAPDDSGRRGAVLVLFGEDPAWGPDVLLIERAHDMRSHAGQPAFPGGAIDDTDADAVAAALREAAEETGLDASGVEVFARLPELWLPPSNFLVTPVLGWWRAPSAVEVVDPREVASVHRVPVSELVDPANRMLVLHPNGFVGPAFTVRGLLVWGFTALLLDGLVEAAGWARPWDTDRVEELPPGAIRTLP